ncbi:paraplegin [Orussus abietinus]|uniref:paraplegin n=1 Tax=Orussus abietinus TaxID=222816 RepID=UPI0006255CAC|nr:paraplegin [Orussus abietinus]
MQSLLKCSARRFIVPRTFLALSINSGVRQVPSLHQRYIQTWLQDQNLRHLRREFRAFQSLLRRSNLNGTIGYRQCLRSLSTSSDRRLQKDNSSNPSGSGKGPKKDDDFEKLLPILIKMFVWLLSFYLVLFFFSKIPKNNILEESSQVSWHEFVHEMLAKGEVQELVVRPELEAVFIYLYPGAIIKGRRALFPVYHMSLADISKLEEKIREAEHTLGIKPDQGVQIVYERSGEVISSIIASVILITLILALFRGRLRGNFSMDIFSQMTSAKYTLVDPLTGTGKGVRFADVAGLKEAKIEIMEFVDYLKHPEHYRTLGAKVPRGALLLGPPGCGKTLLAKAVATEANVPFLSMNGSEFIEMIGGLGAARVRDLFKEGRKRAPSIIYIDEIDAIGKKRAEELSFQSSGESEQTLNQLLVEMDGMSSKEGVIVLASTNRSEVLDKALLRPGRFDRHILIDLPTLEERKQIFEQHLKGITLEHAPSTYSKRLAYLTPGFSGADIANVCNEAALHAARFKKKIVDGSDLMYAIDRTVGGTEKKSHAISPSEKRVVAYHEAGHALVGWLLEHTDALLKVTIVPRTTMALGFAQYTPADQKLYNQEQLFDRMCMALGGRVAESLVFNKITTGAQNDLDKVTKMAYSQVQEFGMSPVVGLLAFDKEHLTTKNKKLYSKKLAYVMDEEARRLIARAYTSTETLLRQNMDKLELIASNLLKRETLSHEDIEKLIGPPPYGKKVLIELLEFEGSNNSPQASTPEPAAA